MERAKGPFIHHHRVLELVKLVLTEVKLNEPLAYTAAKIVKSNFGKTQL